MSVRDEGRCKSCGARPRIVLNAEGEPLDVRWEHRKSCQRDRNEDLRLRSLGRSAFTTMHYGPVLDIPERDQQRDQEHDRE